MYLPVYKHKKELRLRDGFLVVVLFWTVLGVAGGLPIYLSGIYDISVTDAVFESISGITTTGATVIVGIDDLPHSLLLYRQELQWLGGMGIIVLAVAVLPMLGVGGMQLFRAETPGPVKDTKLTPRITETAKALWYIYLGLTSRLLPGLLGRRHVFFRCPVAFLFYRRDRRVSPPTTPVSVFSTAPRSSLSPSFSCSCRVLISRSTSPRFEIVRCSPTSAMPSSAPISWCCRW